MIRAVMGSALSLAGLGLAAAYLWPGVAEPGGEPMVVAPVAAAYQLARLDDAACASVLLRADRPSPATSGDSAEGAHAVIAVRVGPRGEPLAIEQVVMDAAAAETLVFVFDDSGRILAAGYPTDGSDGCLSSSPERGTGTI
jgi:hypothetical protein